MTTLLRLNQIVTNLGPWVLGRNEPARLGVWTQGCSLGRGGACDGCMSKHTHDEGGSVVSVSEILRLAVKHQQSGGLVVSGGEPSDQPEAIAELTMGYKQKFPKSPVQLYSGRTLNWIHKNKTNLLTSVDVLVANTFQIDRPPSSLAGSNNQQVILLTELGRKRFSGWQNWPRKIQLVSQNNKPDYLTLVGIPDRSVSTDLKLITSTPED